MAEECQQAQDADGDKPGEVAEHVLSFLNKLEAAADFAAAQPLFKNVQRQDPVVQKRYVRDKLQKL
jgi:hypothetical protein